MQQQRTAATAADCRAKARTSHLSLFRGDSPNGFQCTWEGSDTRPSRKQPRPAKDSKLKVLRAGVWLQQNDPLICGLAICPAAFCFCKACECVCNDFSVIRSCFRFGLFLHGIGKSKRSADKCCKTYLLLFMEQRHACVHLLQFCPSEMGMFYLFHAFCG